MKKLYYVLLALLAGCSHLNQLDFFPLVSIQIQDRNGMTETISSPDRLGPYQNVDFLASQPYKKIVRVYKHNGKMEAKITTYHPNGQIWQYLESQDMRAFGAYKEWHSNGVMKIDTTVIGGTADVATGAQRDWLFDGPAKVWNEQGEMLGEFQYVKGVLQGKSVAFHHNGKIRSESFYHQNQLDGNFTEYYPDGNVRSITSYQKGIKTGQCTGLWENGSHSWEETYQDHLLLEGRYYAQGGTKVSEVISGFGFQAIFKDTVLEQLHEYRRGLPEGVVKIFWPSGELKSQYHLKNGRRQGEESQYFLATEREEPGPELLPKLVIPWEGDSISGLVKTWYNNGKLQSQREFARNKKSGSSLAWYRNGSLMYIEEYEDDSLVKGQYFKKNQKELISQVSNGNGTATLFDEHGVLLRKVVYAKGKAIDPEN